jgi:hypothetical protein
MEYINNYIEMFQSQNLNSYLFTPRGDKDNVTRRTVSPEETKNSVSASLALLAKTCAILSVDELNLTVCALNSQNLAIQ